MKLDDVIMLAKAGYSKEEISAFESENIKETTPETKPKTKTENGLVEHETKKETTADTKKSPELKAIEELIKVIQASNTRNDNQGTENTVSAETVLKSLIEGG